MGYELWVGRKLKYIFEKNAIISNFYVTFATILEKKCLIV